MLDIKLIRESPGLVRENLKRRKDDRILKNFDELIKVDEKWRSLKNDLDQVRHERNDISKKINEAKKAGEDPKDMFIKAKQIPIKLKEIEEEIKHVESKRRDLLLVIPNLMHESVPYGKDDSENVELSTWGDKKEPSFELKSHSQIMEDLNIGSFERSAKIAGAGFYFLYGDLALLNQALIRFAIDHMIKHGFLYTETPLMMDHESYEGVTDVDSFRDVMYKVEDEDLYMIATSEHPLIAQHKDDEIPAKTLPLKYTAYSMCFRKEIGSHGVDTKGLFRTHQFNKVEMIVICKPENSWKMHEEMTSIAKEILVKLNIPHRLVNICTGDLGSIASKKYDLEVYSPRQKKYTEIGSCSNCTDYQARRLNIRIVDEKGERHFAHTLNNTVIATSRMLVAILEHYQNEDGSISIPDVLQPYMNGKKVIS